MADVDLSFMEQPEVDPSLSFMEEGKDHGASGLDFMQKNTQPLADGVAKPVRGFFDNLRNPIDLIKKESIPAHLIDYFTTTQKEFDERNAAEKESIIQSIPALRQLSDKLDEWDYVADSRELTSEEQDRRFALIDAYGTLYEEMEKAYDEGKFEQGFSLEGMKAAIANDPGGALAEFVNALAADPEMALLPFGWDAAAAKTASVTAKFGTTVEKVASTTAGLSSAAILGGGVSAIDEASRQLATTGRLDADKIEDAAQLGAIAAPGLYTGGKLAKSGINKSRIRKANKQLDAFENRIGEYREQGLNQKTAIERAAKDLGIKEKKVAKYTRIAGRKVKVNNKDPDLHTRTLTNKLARAISDSFVGKSTRAIGGVADNLLGSVSTRIGNISPKIMHELRRHDHTVHVDALKLKTDVRRFIEEVRKLPKRDREFIKQALLSGDKKTVDAYLSKQASREFVISYTDHVIPSLDRIHTMLENVGHKVDKVDTFFPRIVKDYDMLLKLMNRNQKTTMQKALDKVSKKKGDTLTPAERSEVINKMLRKPEFQGIQFGLSTTKGRKIQKISSKWLDAYYDLDDALELYITQAVHNIHKRQFFGYGKAHPADADLDIDRSVGSLLDRELMAGNITLDDAMKLKPLLIARFSGGERQAAKSIQHTKNIFYSATIGNPLSAITQFGDIAIASYMHGFVNSIRSVFSKRQVKLADIGIDLAAQEFESTVSTARFLNKMLKLSVFRFVDKLGKETHINAALRKYQSWSKHPKKFKRIETKYKDAFTDKEMAKLLKDLRQKKVGEEVKYVLWSELSDAQPIALSEMPAAYLNHPNGRIFYMLKTFTIKQLDILRRDALQKLFSGQKVEGTRQLLGLVGTMTIANLSVSEIKDFILGREEDVSDKLVSNMVKNFGLSEYILKDAQNRGVTSAVLELVMPPLNVVDSAIEDLANLGQQFKSLRYMPIAGSLAYNWFGGGLEKWEERKEREE